MQPVPAAKGCTSEESGARCPCPQFVLGGKEIRFVCVNCGHVEAEHVPCVLTREELLQGPSDMRVNGRCSACGLDVGRHLRAGDTPSSERLLEPDIHRIPHGWFFRIDDISDSNPIPTVEHAAAAEP